MESTSLQAMRHDRRGDRARPAGPNARLAVVIAALGALGGCAAVDVKPVADFGNTAIAWSESYRPLVADLSTTCIERRLYRGLEEPGPYDARSARDGAATDCRPLVDAGKTADHFADAVSAYAAALVTLAKAKPDALSDNIGDVVKAAGSLKEKGGDAYFNSTQISAASKIASTAVDLLLAKRRQTLTRELLERNQEPLATTVGAMKFFAVDIYGGELRNTKLTVDSVRDRLRAASDTQALGRASPVPVRLAQREVYDDLRAIDDREQAIARFATAADALVAAHADLVAKFDTLDSNERVASVSDFFQKVKAFRSATGL